MDPLTHLAAGALTGLAAKTRFPQMRGVLPLCLAASVLPDIDNFTGRLGPEQYLLFHRGVTHSLVGIAVQAILLAGLVRLLPGGPDFRPAAILAAAVLAMHVFLDLATSYGTQILAPFSHHRFSFDAVFIIDPLFTGAMLVLLLLAGLGRHRRMDLCVAGLVWVLLYPVACLGVRTAMEHRYARQVPGGSESALSVRIIPEAFAPFFWKAVADDGDRYFMTTLATLDPKAEYPTAILPKADLGFMRRLGESASIFKTYAWFAVFPFEQVAVEGPDTVVQFGDLRFLSTFPPVERFYSRGRPPFLLTAVLDSDGVLREYRYQNRGVSLVQGQVR